MTEPRIYSSARSLAKSSAEYRLLSGDCVSLLNALAAEGPSVKLLVSSPPYNIGKDYEERVPIETYLEWQHEVIDAISSVVLETGHVCWQVGNYVNNGQIKPLDLYIHGAFEKRGFVLRNRIIWTYNHGPHCRTRFSGRYEVILWYTKSNNPDAYTFNLDAVRVPPKYPNKKYFKGPRKGQRSCNPKGKNPGDVWSAQNEELMRSITSDVWDNIPNVKGQHIEKTGHPCQFPVGLVERLVLALSNPGDLVLDPFMGSGTSGVAAALHNRRFAGSDKDPVYVKAAQGRIKTALSGIACHRPHHLPLYIPSKSEARIYPKEAH